MTCTYPTLCGIHTLGRWSNDEPKLLQHNLVSSLRERLYCLLGTARRDFVNNAHEYVTLNFPEKWKFSTAPAFSLTKLKEETQKQLPKLNFLNSLTTRILQITSLYKNDPSRGLFSNTLLLLARGVNRVASLFWNWASHTDEKAEAVEHALKGYREDLPWFAIGYLTSTSKGGKGEVRLSYILDRDENEGYLICPTRLRLKTDSSIRSLSLELEKGLDESLIVSIGSIEKEKALFAMRVAVELMNASPIYKRVWLKYSGDVDFKPYGFQVPCFETMSTNEGEGEQWVKIDKEGLKSRNEELSKLISLSSEISSEDSYTWQSLIQRHPLLKLNPNTGFFENDVP